MATGGGAGACSGTSCTQVARAAFRSEAEIPVRALDTAGLRAAADRGYLVAARAARELRRKMGLMDAGTIALCGPRGVGKTTLLESAMEEAALSVHTHTRPGTPRTTSCSPCSPVSARPTSRYAGSPSVLPPPGLVRAARPLGPRHARRALLRLLAVPAAVLLVLGLRAGAADLGELYGRPAEERLRELGDFAVRDARLVWHGDRVGAALAVALLGLAWWRLGRVRWAARAAGLLWRGVCTVLGAALVVVPFGTLLTDPDVYALLGVMESGNDGLSDAVRVMAAYGVLTAVVTFLDGRAARGDDLWTWWRKGAPHVLALVVAWMLLRDETCRAVVTDDGNPGRLATLLAGLMLLPMSDWRPRGATPPLVKRCRDQLLHLRTVQSRAATWSTAVPAAGIGVQVGTSLSTVPPNFPELVDDFRDLLGRVAREVHDRGGRVVVAVDELDRLGDGATVLAFLNEIKAVFGVPYVHYLVSVADDVGAAFVRRGLPHRDAADSTLDDIVSVQPCLPDESGALLARAAARAHRDPRPPGARAGRRGPPGPDPLRPPARRPAPRQHRRPSPARPYADPRRTGRGGLRLPDAALPGALAAGRRRGARRLPRPGGAVAARPAASASAELDAALRTFAFEGRVTSREVHLAVPDAARSN
ncbi:KAP NTPase domain-containing protein OS=Streptomyces fumanus OX=67302 GN=GCM10018772_42580 PE=4 SV=1 [Streptomyces fumanus]